MNTDNPARKIGAAPDYFEAAETAEEEILRRIKGDFRRRLMRHFAEEDGIGTCPPAMLEHGLSETLKEFLQAQNPRGRGGEDLPDLDDGEVEIARMSLIDSIHGEVTSLRARRLPKPGKVAYRMVDEYDAEIELPRTESDGPLSAGEVLAMFSDSDPCQTAVSCLKGFQSWFYPRTRPAGRR